MKECPCGTTKDYTHCCSLYIDNGQLAVSPEILMRSRYCAYTMGKIEYIEQTMRGKALIGFEEREAKRWARRVNWIGLQVLNVIPEDKNKGYVEFVALFMDKGTLQSIHEISEFEKIEGRWFYTDGNQLI